MSPTFLPPPPSFLTLPPELRLHIYAHLPDFHLATSPPQQQQQQQQQDHRITPATALTPNLSRTSRLLRAETLPVCAAARARRIAFELDDGSRVRAGPRVRSWIAALTSAVAPAPTTVPMTAEEDAEADAETEAEEAGLERRGADAEKEEFASLTVAAVMARADTCEPSPVEADVQHQQQQQQQQQQQEGVYGTSRHNVNGIFKHKMNGEEKTNGEEKKEKEKGAERAVEPLLALPHMDALQISRHWASERPRRGEGHAGLYVRLERRWERERRVDMNTNGNANETENGNSDQTENGDENEMENGNESGNENGRRETVRREKASDKSEGKREGKQQRWQRRQRQWRWECWVGTYPVVEDRREGRFERVLAVRRALRTELGCLMDEKEGLTREVRGGGEANNEEEEEDMAAMVVDEGPGGGYGRHLTTRDVERVARIVDLTAAAAPLAV